MLQKESYGFITYAAIRIGEIQTSTNPEDWKWVESSYNIADWTTRGKHPTESMKRVSGRMDQSFYNFQNHNGQ